MPGRRNRPAAARNESTDRPLSHCPSAYLNVYSKSVTTEARRAIIAIRDCIEKDRYALTVHFSQRMHERGLFWPDVQAVVDAPDDVRSQGTDVYDRPKWIIRGIAALDEDIEIVCALETNESGAEFITLYWED